MNLRNNTITLGELLDNPAAKAVLQRRFSQLLAHPMLGSARHLSLKQIISMAGNQVSRQSIQATLQELQAL